MTIWPGVRRIGQDLLVAGHRRVEHDFADRVPGAPIARPRNTVPSASASIARRRRRKAAAGGRRGGGGRSGHGGGAIGSRGSPAERLAGVRTCEAGTPASPAAVPALKLPIIPARARPLQPRVDAAPHVSTPPKIRRRRTARGRSRSRPRRDARNTAAPAISGGSPQRPAGVRRATHAENSASAISGAFISVLKNPGAMPFTWMFERRELDGERARQHPERALARRVRRRCSAGRGRTRASRC